jgi:hypothetical protein
MDTNNSNREKLLRELLQTTNDELGDEELLHKRPPIRHAAETRDFSHERSRSYGS